MHQHHDFDRRLSNEVGTHRPPTSPPIVVITGLALAIFVLFVALFATVVNYLVAIMIVLVAIVAGIHRSKRVFQRARRGSALGGGLIAGGCLSLLLVPQWIDQRANNRIVDHVAAQTCALDLEGIDIVSCDGDLAHTYNGNYCDIRVSMVVTSRRSFNELRNVLMDTDYPQSEERGTDDLEIEKLEGGSGETKAEVVSLGGFVKDWRCG